MKFKELRASLKEKNEEGKPETTKKFADATPGQPPVTFTPDPAFDGHKIAQELDPAGGIKKQVDKAVNRQDTDVDGDVDDQDAHTPDEIPQNDKKNQTLHMLKKGAAERAHTKKGVAYESTMVEKLSATDDTGKWIDDFQSSSAPQFAGKNAEERRKMAVAAHLAAKEKAGISEATNAEVQKVLGPTKNAAQGIAALKKAFNVDDKKAKEMLDKAMKSMSEEVELEEAKNYEIKDGRIHISKANFRKIHKDYKNATKGKESMIALDPETGATSLFQVVFTEGTEIEEGYIVKYHAADGAHKNSSKVFSDKSKAQKHADMGNKINKVGGKYTVHKVDTEGRSVKEDVELDEVKAVNYTLGNKPDKDYSYQITRNGQPKEGDVYHSLEDAQRVIKNMKRTDNTRSKFGIKRIAKDKLAGPIGKLPEEVSEALDKTSERLKQLVRLGLMDKSKISVLSRAMKSLEKGQVTNPSERETLFELLNELVGLITGDDAMFAKVRMNVQKD